MTVGTGAIRILLGPAFDAFVAEELGAVGATFWFKDYFVAYLTNKDVVNLFNGLVFTQLWKSAIVR